MYMYRCYFLDDSDCINAAENIEADAVTDAIGRALAMLDARPHHRAVEVWQGSRRLYFSAARHSDAEEAEPQDVGQR